MKCLLFGGTGFIGKNLSKALAQKGHEVSIVSRNKSIIEKSECHYEHYELSLSKDTEDSTLQKVLKNQDVIIQLISTTTPQNSNDDPIYDVESNLITTLKILKNAREQGVKKIIFLSSGGTIYGQPQLIPIPENHPIVPLCSYGIIKHTIEHYLSLYSHLYKMDYCILRLSNPYGQYQLHNRNQGVIPTFLYKALSKQDISIWGDGEVVRDYIYISDVTDAIINAIDYEGAEKIFNIGSGVGKSLNALLTEIEKIVGHTIVRHYSPNRIFDVKSNVLDISKSQECLQWAPKIALESGLSKTLEWIKSSYP